MYRSKGLIVLTVIAVVAGSVLLVRHQRTHSPEVVMQRAVAYWEAVRLGDALTQYQMETNTALGLVKPHEFVERKPFGARVLRYHLGEVTVEDDSAKIEIETESTLMEMNGHTLPAKRGEDVWTFINGEWFHGAIPVPPTPASSAQTVKPPEPSPSTLNAETAPPANQ